MTELEAFAILASIPNLGAIKIRSLLDHFGSAQNALAAPPEQIALLPGFKQIGERWNGWKHNPSWQRDIELARRTGARLLPFTDPDFPKALLALPDHPALLYVRGTLLPQDKRSIAVVGTRNATIYGLEAAEAISRRLAACGFTVVSGLARGIDTAAHRGALEAGRTIAVIGSGLCKIYPSENQELAEKICAGGALITEFPMETPPDRQNFPQRNRIVSGMTLATLLVEAPVKSGAMITMDRAHQQKKLLFALPGRVDSENFKGNHALIKSGKARLVENGDEIIAHFDTLLPPQAATPSAGRHPNLDKEEMALLDKMPLSEISIDELTALASIPVQQVQRVLMSLMLKKIVKEFPGKMYKKLQSKA